MASLSTSRTTFGIQVLPRLFPLPLLLPLLLQASLVLADHHRWQHPCSGASQLATRVHLPPFPQIRDHTHHQHGTISRQASELQLQRLRPLLNAYEQGFGLSRAAMTELSTMMEAPLLGSPLSEVTSTSSGDSLTTLQTQYKHLSQLAVLLEHIMNDQLHDQHNEALSGIREFGVYWILCAIQRLISELGSRVTLQQVRGVPVPFQRMRTSANQKLRDYTVLRGLEIVLRKIQLENESMAERTIQKRTEAQKVQ